MTTNTEVFGDLQHHISPAIGWMRRAQTANKPVNWDDLAESVDRAADAAIDGFGGTTQMRPMVAAAIGSFMYPETAQVLIDDRNGLPYRTAAVADAFRDAADAAAELITSLTVAMAAGDAGRR